MGRQYGEQARAEIEANCAWLDTGRKVREARSYFAQAEAGIGRLAPDLLAELRGLAEGADLPLAEIVCCNHYNPGGPTVGCTPMAVAAGPDGPILAKNNDGAATEERRFVVHATKPDRGLPVTTVTYAGWLSGLDAANAAGLALGHASVGSIFPRPGPRIDIRLWSYGLLRECRTTSEFLARLGAAPLTGKGFNVVAVDRAGTTAVVEAAVPVLARRDEDAPFVFATNHYVTAELREADRRTPRGKEVSTYRFGYLKWVAETEPPGSLADIQRILASHEPWAPCRHGGPHGSVTLWSMIALPRDGRLLLAAGPPCRTPYEELPF
jgi:predicted choloylglycine hydrolase